MQRRRKSRNPLLSSRSPLEIDSENAPLSLIHGSKPCISFLNPIAPFKVRNSCTPLRKRKGLNFLFSGLPLRGPFNHSRRLRYALKDNQVQRKKPEPNLRQVKGKKPKSTSASLHSLVVITLPVTSQTELNLSFVLSSFVTFPSLL